MLLPEFFENDREIPGMKILFHKFIPNSNSLLFLASHIEKWRKFKVSFINARPKSFFLEEKNSVWRTKKFKNGVRDWTAKSRKLLKIPEFFKKIRRETTKGLWKLKHFHLLIWYTASKNICLDKILRGILMQSSCIVVFHPCIWSLESNKQAKLSIMYLVLTSRVVENCNEN